MAESIGNIIKEWLKQNSLEQRASQESIPQYWLEIVGETLAKNTTVEKIDKGKMFVKASNSVWKQEILISRENIRKKVNEHFGAEIITEIIVQ